MATLKDLKKTGEPGIFYREHPTRRHGVKKDRQWVIRQTLGGKTHISTLGWLSQGCLLGDALNKAAEYKANFQWNRANPDQPPKPICKAAEDRIAKERAAEIARQQRLQEQQPTVRELADDWQDLHFPHISAKSAYDYRNHLAKRILPYFGDTKVKDLDRAAIARWHDGMVKRTPRQGTATLTVFKSLLSWAEQRGRIDDNPAAKVKPAVRHKPKDRVLTEQEIRLLWHWLDDVTRSDQHHQGSNFCPAIARALKLVLLVGCRPGEVAGIHSSEIQGDWWTLPASRSKNGNEHRVYLTPTAKSLFVTETGYLLPSPRRRDKPLRSDALCRAVTRHRDALTDLGIASFTPHDLRRSAATHIARLGHSSVVPDMLGHAPQGITRQVYDKYTRDDEKARAWTAWEQELLRLVNGQPAKVIPFSRSVLA